MRARTDFLRGELAVEVVFGGECSKDPLRFGRPALRFYCTRFPVAPCRLLRFRRRHCIDGGQHLAPVERAQRDADLPRQLRIIELAGPGIPTERRGIEPLRTLISNQPPDITAIGLINLIGKPRPMLGGNLRRTARQTLHGEHQRFAPGSRFQIKNFFIKVGLRVHRDARERRAIGLFLRR
jgi:hypothetical protein